MGGRREKEEEKKEGENGWERARTFAINELGGTRRLKVGEVTWGNSDHFGCRIWGGRSDRRGMNGTGGKSGERSKEDVVKA
jgi:hypothetical protein